MKKESLYSILIVFFIIIFLAGIYIYSIGESINEQFISDTNPQYILYSDNLTKDILNLNSSTGISNSQLAMDIRKMNSPYDISPITYPTTTPYATTSTPYATISSYNPTTTPYATTSSYFPTTTPYVPTPTSYGPMSITGLILWYDATNTTSYSFSSDGNLSELIDKSGNNNNSLSNVAIPIDTTGVTGFYSKISSRNDLPVFVLLNGGFEGDFTTTTTIQGNKLSFFMICSNNFDSRLNSRTLSLGNDDNTNDDSDNNKMTVCLKSSDSSNILHMIRNNVSATFSNLTSDALYLVSGYYDGTGNGYFGINGAYKSFQSTGNFNITKFGFGTNVQNEIYGRNYGGETFGEMLIYNTSLSDSDRQLIEQHLMNKWKITPAPTTTPYVPTTTPYVPTTTPYFPTTTPYFPTTTPYIPTAYVPTTTPYVPTTRYQITSPREIPGLKVWFDGNDPASYQLVTTTNGHTHITQLNDKSENGNNARATTYGATILLLPGGFNGLNGLHLWNHGVFNNLNNGNGSQITGNKLSFFMICRNNFDTTMSRRVISLGNDNNTQDYTDVNKLSVHIKQGDTSRILYMVRNGKTAQTPILDAWQTYLISGYFDGENGYFGVNGTYYKSFPSTENFNITNFGFGTNTYYKSDGGDFSGIQFGEMLIYNGDMTNENRVLVEQYLMNKWGVPSYVPVATYFPTNSYNPMGITGLILWYDATNRDSYTTIETVSGSSELFELIDESGNDNRSLSNVINGYGSASRMEAKNSLQVFSLRNGGFENDFTTGIQGNKLSFFMICSNEFNSAMNSRTLSLGNDVNTNDDSDNNKMTVCLKSSDPGILYMIRNNVSATFSNLTPESLYLVSGYYDGTNGYFGINGTYKSFPSTGNFNITKFGFGTNVQNVNYGLNYGGETFGEMLIYNTSLSNSDRVVIEQYLMNKWKITTTVPTTTPYVPTTTPFVPTTTPFVPTTTPFVPTTTPFVPTTTPFVPTTTPFVPTTTPFVPTTTPFVPTTTPFVPTTTPFVPTTTPFVPTTTPFVPTTTPFVPTTTPFVPTTTPFPPTTTNKIVILQKFGDVLIDITKIEVTTTNNIINNISSSNADWVHLEGTPFYTYTLLIDPPIIIKSIKITRGEFNDVNKNLTGLISCHYNNKLVRNFSINTPTSQTFDLISGTSSTPYVAPTTTPFVPITTPPRCGVVPNGYAADTTISDRRFRAILDNIYDDMYDRTNTGTSLKEMATYINPKKNTDIKDGLPFLTDIGNNWLNYYICIKNINYIFVKIQNLTSNPMYLSSSSSSTSSSSLENIGIVTNVTIGKNSIYYTKIERPYILSSLTLKLSSSASEIKFSGSIIYNNKFSNFFSTIKNENSVMSIITKKKTIDIYAIKTDLWGEKEYIYYIPDTTLLDF